MARTSKQSHISGFQILQRLQRQRLIRLSPRDAMRAEQLVRTREHWSLDELALALASLLATDRQSWHDIHGYIVRLADSGLPMLTDDTEHHDSDHDRDTKADSKARRRKRRPPRRTWRQFLAGLSTRFWLGLTTAIVLLPPLTVTVFALLEPEPTISRIEPPPPAEPTFDTGSDPEPSKVTFEQVEAAINIPGTATADTNIAWDQPLMWLMLLVSVLLAAQGRRWLRLPAEAKARREQNQRKGLEQREQLARTNHGQGEPYHLDRAPPFAQAAMDDAAAILGRVGDRIHSPDLNLDATIDRTARKAGRLTPVFEPSQRPLDRADIARRVVRPRRRHRRRAPALFTQRQSHY